MTMPAREPGRPCGLWLGDAAGFELESVAGWLAGRVDLVRMRTVDDALAWEKAPNAGRRPAIVFLAAARPGRWPLSAVVAAARRWPLATIVGVTTSLGEGRRRSGPVLPGVEEIAWHDLPGRLQCWLADLGMGHAGPLGTPATARREERLLDALDALARTDRASRVEPVAIAGSRGADLDGLADLLTLAGRRVAETTNGRPSLDTASPLLLWDVVDAGVEDLAWLRMLAANRPGLGIVLLDSFPRGDSTEAALRAGAAAVLGRPFALDVLEGTLRRVERMGRENRVANGLGGSAGGR